MLKRLDVYIQNGFGEVNDLWHYSQGHALFLNPDIFLSGLSYYQYFSNVLNDRRGLVYSSPTV